ncbi:MAG: hypothetical protein GQ507_03475 [Dehalococcoidales bacterium]|nr:hypothetical protein [Dehalococcoidales bacterium]
MTTKDSLQPTEKSPSISNSSNKNQGVSKIRKDSQMKAIVNERGRAGYIWLIIAILSVIIIFVSIFFMAFPEITFDISMEYAGSPLTWESLDEGSKVAMHFLIVRPFWDEILFAILGLFCAWGLKKRESFAWKLGVFWGVMMLVAGIALGLSELYIGKWPTVCMVTFVYSIIGVIALSCLLVVKKEFN